MAQMYAVLENVAPASSFGDFIWWTAWPTTGTATLGSLSFSVSSINVEPFSKLKGGKRKRKGAD